jgi:hypothetical protein
VLDSEQGQQKLTLAEKISWHGLYRELRVTRVHPDTRGMLRGKVCLQLRLREDHREDRDLPFPQGCDGLLERPGIDPKVVHQGDQGALVGARIGSSVYVVRIE